MSLSSFLLLQRLIRYLELIFTGQVTPAAIVTSIICIIIIIVIDIVNKLLKKYIQKIPIYIPAQLIVVSTICVSSYVSFLTSLHFRWYCLLV